MNLRINIELSVPIDAGTKKVSANAEKELAAIGTAVDNLKKEAADIKPGTGIAEVGTKAVYHICYHDEAVVKPCESEQPIADIVNYDKKVKSGMGNG